MTEKKEPSPQEIAQFEEQNMKDWKQAMDALECSTFHGRHAKAIAGLFEFAKANYDQAKNRLDAAIERIKTPMATFGKPQEAPKEGVAA